MKLDKVELKVCDKCEYVCDTPRGSFCTLTNIPVELTDCLYVNAKEEENHIEETVKWLHL